MTLFIMTLLAVLVGLTTMGGLTWAYFAEDRACTSAKDRGARHLT